MTSPVLWLCLYLVELAPLGFMAVFFLFSRTLGLGNRALCAGLSRITLTTTSARPLGEFLYVLPFYISFFRSSQRGYLVPKPSSGFHPSQWESIPIVKTLTEIQAHLSCMSSSIIFIFLGQLLSCSSLRPVLWSPRVLFCRLCQLSFQKEDEAQDKSPKALV